MLASVTTLLQRLTVCEFSEPLPLRCNVQSLARLLLSTVMFLESVAHLVEIKELVTGVLYASLVACHHAFKQWGVCQLRRQDIQLQRVSCYTFSFFPGLTLGSFLSETFSLLVHNDITGCVPQGDIWRPANEPQYSRPGPEHTAPGSCDIDVKRRPLNPVRLTHLKVSDSAGAFKEFACSVLDLRVRRELRDPECGDGFAPLDEQVALCVSAAERYFEEILWVVRPLEFGSLWDD